MGRLQGKRALITGGAGGIGAAAAKLFVAEGAKVFLVDRDAAGLAAAASAAGGGTGHRAGDVTSEAETQAFVAAAAAHMGGIDIALLNAGVEGLVKRITETPVAEFDRVMAINVRGVWLGLAHVLPVMQRQGTGGSIVITSSIAGVRASTSGMMAPYVTSKHAVIGLMKSAAMEGAPHNIRVNTINPAPIETRMTADLALQISPNDPSAMRRKFESTIPLRRFGTADEVARLMLFLASDEASFCTGATYLIDGGATAGPS
jgi:NAD(P)-dependent dehydrogenase (short-subunit alcohol dehydrogenase family)